MKPEIESQELNAFVDGELEVFGQREIEQRLEHDAGLRAQVEALRRLCESLRAHADYHVAPEAFRRRIAALAVAALVYRQREHVVNSFVWPPQRPTAPRCSRRKEAFRSPTGRAAA